MTEKLTKGLEMLAKAVAGTVIRLEKLEKLLNVEIKSLKRGC